MVYSMTHRPGEEDFNRWLQTKYHIKCSTVSCTMKEAETGKLRTLLVIGSRTKEGYLIFNTVSKTFEGKDGNHTTIKALGFLGHYYTIVEELEPQSERG
ncbi:hypothetical protein D3H55_08335 [Bacillus salacetis]|uniref:Uncharacterized protein n=2 Tax=Bacillus salacetis TaxID=2315464 RepID=A0A3A1R372_9BACI|nr:hypothetical protein D3H55_08335 [Bacillus salacetis]